MTAASSDCLQRGVAPVRLILGVEHCAGGAPFRTDSGAAELEIAALEPVEVRRLLWEGVRLLDARSARDHAQAPHGAAVHLCHQASQLELRQRVPDQQEILVCASNREQRARRLAVRLSRLGYRHVYVLRGGLAGLKDQPPA